ncbi:PqqD family protein of HPr-rel-A system [Hephaestia caeni]|uniref:PqqD family protein of HPr-rel-A system n=1 Tax=Hephaestia caeni TaxID=645617 RepID=A0A397PL52_9SPHN|nr:HPr-rel-A system PqqD family peptide chaperone [Hephaestia caeni]RIA46844.1 PqqD family protein of HPr-rel-A system [Hephaestia caeni]
MTGYARVPAAEIVSVALDDFTALYHRASGITHLVTSPVPELLDVLEEAPLGLGEIAARLAAVFEVEDEDALAVRLDELVAAGLVVRT